MTCPEHQGDRTNGADGNSDQADGAQAAGAPSGSTHRGGRFVLSGYCGRFGVVCGFFFNSAITTSSAFSS